MTTTGSILKWTRTVVSALFLTLLTMGAVGVPAVLVAVCDFAWRAQIVSTSLTLSLGTFVFWFIVTLLLGRVYCSTVCPIGAVQDVVASLRRRRRYRYSESRLPFAVGMLVVMALAAVVGITTVVRLLNPASQYSEMVKSVMSPTLLGVVIAVATLLLIVVMAWKGGRLYCNTICPLGGALGLVSRASFMHVEIDPDKCIRCRKCVDVCKAECIEIETCVVDNARCVACFNCLPVCPNDAIAYKAQRKQLATPMFQRVERKMQPTAIEKGVPVQQQYKDNTTKK